jgi:hypothetical protein
MVHSARPTLRTEKTVHVRIDPNDESTTLEDVLHRISELQRKHPDREVFFDGDEYAICSRPKRARAPAAH